jgi:hypothetical protein
MTAEGSTLIVPTIIPVNDLEHRHTIICEQVLALGRALDTGEALGFDRVRVLNRTDEVAMTC